MPMTAESKRRLSDVVRKLRQRILEDLHAVTEGEYRLSVAVEQAGLSEAARIRRQRLDAWLDEQVRTVKKADRKALRDRFRRDVEKEAASTLLNRLVLLRLLEAAGLSSPEVLTGGWNSKGYREFRGWARLSRPMRPKATRRCSGWSTTSWRRSCRGFTEMWA